MYQGSTTPSIYLPTVRYENPFLCAFLIGLGRALRGSTGSQYWKTLPPAMRAAAGDLVRPTGLIASIDAFGVIKPLGRTSLWDAAARAACEGGSSDHHGCAAVKKKKRDKRNLMGRYWLRNSTINSFFVKPTVIRYYQQTCHTIIGMTMKEWVWLFQCCVS